MTGDVENPYIKHFFSGSLEVCVMALRQWESTQNASQDGHRLLELSDAVLMFYREHWRFATANGTMQLLNSSGCESWPRCDDPAPEVAGLVVLLEGLMALPAEVAAASALGPTVWKQMLASVPPLPLVGNRSRGIAPCRASHAPQIEGGEGVELYPVWPFLLFTAAQTAAQAQRFPQALGRHSWRDGGSPQINTMPGGHNSAPMVQAAALGLAVEAQAALVWEHKQRPRSTNRGFNESYGGDVPRFVGFWGTFTGLNCSTDPYGKVTTSDMCTFGDTDPYPGTAAKQRVALQLMLMQTAAPANAHTAEGRLIVLFPGWPRSWGDVSFKLHAPLNTTVACELKDGVVKSLVVKPAFRRSDVVIAPLQSTTRLQTDDQAAKVRLSDFVGANGASGDQWYQTQHTLTPAGGGPVRWLRSKFDWNSAERVQGQWTWKTSDLQRVVAAKSAGLNFLPMLISSGGNWAGPHLGPAYNTSLWVAFVSGAVTRCRALGVTHFQIWNEPTRQAGFFFGTNEQYVSDVYLPAARAIRNLGGFVVFGGWPGSNSLAELNGVLRLHDAYKRTDIIDAHYRSVTLPESRSDLP